MKKAIYILFALAFVLHACEKPLETETQVQDFDRGAMLKSMADYVIVPAYQNYHDATTALVQKASDFVAQQSESNLDALRDQYTATVLAWQHAAPFDFGPALQTGLLARTNSFPTNVSKIEENVAANSSNLDAANNLTARGLPALDYILFGNNEVLENNENARNYLLTLCETLNTDAYSVLTAWTTQDYRSVFANNTGTDIGGSVGILVNALSKNLEQHTRTYKIGIPLGALTFSQTPLPEKAEGYYQGTASRSFLLESIRAFKNIYSCTSPTGQNGTGLDDYLKALDAKYNGEMLHNVIGDQLDRAAAQVESLPNSISEAVVNNAENCWDAYGDLQTAVVLFKVDMTSALGVLITYQDNDGD